MSSVLDSLSLSNPIKMKFQIDLAAFLHCTNEFMRLFLHICLTLKFGESIFTYFLTLQDKINP